MRSCVNKCKLKVEATDPGPLTKTQKCQKTLKLYFIIAFPPPQEPWIHEAITKINHLLLLVWSIERKHITRSQSWRRGPARTGIMTRLCGVPFCVCTCVHVINRTSAVIMTLCWYKRCRICSCRQHTCTDEHRKCASVSSFTLLLLWLFAALVPQVPVLPLKLCSPHQDMEWGNCQHKANLTAPEQKGRSHKWQRHN